MTALEPNALSGLHVLVVEDEPLLAFELQEELEELGASPVGPVATVESALQLIETGCTIDAAVLNVFLRGSISFPIAHALKQRDIPFLFVTGNDAYVRTHFPDVPHHPKPADMKKIVASLTMFLQERK